MFEIIEAKEIDVRAWDDLLYASPVASWFQSKEAFGFFDGLSFLDAFAYAVLDDGCLKGVAVGYVQKDGGRLKRFLSRRAIVLGGPLLANDVGNDAVACLLQSVKEALKGKAIYIETRNFNDYARWKDAFIKVGFTYEPHYDIVVDTTSMEVVNEHLGKSRKRDIRVSQRDGASVVTIPTWKQVEAYYQILVDLYAVKVKTPLFPLEFFEHLYKLDSSAFLLVEYAGEVVGGTVCVGLKGRALYEMYACGKDGVHKTIFPSELATFAGLQFAAMNGYGCFDMMGAGKPDDGGYGVRDFKLKFGGELVEFGRFVCVCNPLLFQIGKWGVSIMKKL